MKKILAVTFVLLLVAGSTLSVLATNGAFVNSPSGQQAPILIEAENASEDCVAVVTVTSFADRETLDEPTQNKLDDAYNVIATTEDLGTLSEDIQERADDLGIDSKDLVISDLFDVSYSDCESHEVHLSFTITIKPASVENFVAVLHYLDDEWEVIDGVVEGDEITFVADSLSPFAIMSYAENADVQPKAVICPWLLALLLLLLIALLIAWLVSKKKNKKKSADAPKQ